MDELVAWLGQQLDEDEQIAQEAGGKYDSGLRWREVGQTGLDGTVGDEHGSVVVYSTGAGRQHSAHIVRHDPARALREIDAKRKLLDDYAVTARIRDEAAARIKAAGDRPDPKDLDTWDRAQTEAAILEGPVKLAALPLSDRPGYQETWRP